MIKVVTSNYGTSIPIRSTGIARAAVDASQASRLNRGDGIARPLRSRHHSDRTHSGFLSNPPDFHNKGIFGGTLIGWCREVGESHALKLDVLVNGVTACEVTADEYRTDLEAVGVGDGRHGFHVDIAALGIAPEAIVTVRISGRTFELPGSVQQAWLLQP